MKIYLDREYKCHVEETADTVMIVETDVFAGACTAFIEGHRLVPNGHSWTREDGKVFHGPMIAPWKDSRILEAAQAEYERSKAQLSEAEQALKIIFEGEEV